MKNIPIQFHVRGTVEGVGKRKHVIRAANVFLAKGKFLAAYPQRNVRDLVALNAVSGEVAE